MKGKELFIQIIKTTPIDSIIETTGYIDFKTASKLELINFNNFKPKSVGLIFKKEYDTERKWIDFFKEIEISYFVTHYWIYNKNKIIANGFDYPDINFFNPDYYKNSFDEYKAEFNIQFSRRLKKRFSKPNREIEILNVAKYNENYSAEIRTKINNEELDLRFAIKQADFILLKSLINELQRNDKLIFEGIYSSSSTFQELGVTVKKSDIWIHLMVESTRQLISNLIWFQQITDKKEIGKLIIKKRTTTNKPNAR